MSKTDKDEPWWVQATWWRPQHYYCQYDLERGRWEKQPLYRVCDLPPRPVVAPPRFGRKYGPSQCVWDPDWPWPGGYPSGPNTAPPKWFVDHVGHNMERRRARDECLAARKEYRATGEVDVCPTVEKHRHRAQWLFW